VMGYDQLEAGYVFGSELIVHARKTAAAPPPQAELMRVLPSNHGSRA
jgi:hypothetical protein